MIKLPEKFERNGFVYQCLAREGFVALYQRKSKDFNYGDYEVIRIQSHNGYTVKKGTPEEKYMEPSEVYPSSNTWGTYGKTKVSEAEAREAFAEWVNKFANTEPEQYDPEASKKSSRGRKPLDVELVFPDGEWTVQELADNHKVSTGYIHVHLKPLLASGDVIMVGARKLTSGRGKPTNLYRRADPKKQRALAVR